MKNLLAVCLAALFFAPMTTDAAKKNKKKEKRPTVCIWNYDNMLKIREDLKKNPSSQYRTAYNDLIKKADKALNQKPISVADKDDDCTAASGDKRDFITVGKYAWPNPNTPDGMPWIRTDCVINPNYKRYDATRQLRMNSALQALTLAYFYTGDEKYADKAVDFIRTWFVTPETRMNPHLTYSSVTPGRNNNLGMPIGIIEGRAFVETFAFISLVENSKAFDKTVKEGTRKWAKEMYDWLTTSEFGIKESKARNNHGVAYDQQLLAYALYSGDKATAEKIAREFPTKSIATHIEPSGKQPLELKRGFGYHYSNYNIVHFVQICEMVKEIDPDLYDYTTADGRSIRAAIDFLTSFLGKPVEAFAPYKQTEGWEAAQRSVALTALTASGLDKERGQAYRDMYAKYGQKRSVNTLLY